jgi:hypothetical protein
VLRFNAMGSAGLVDGKVLSQPSKLNDVQSHRLLRMVKTGRTSRSEV